MNLLVLMSIAGTIPILIYYLIGPVLKKTGPNQNIQLLKLSMFFFLCPFQLLKYVIPVKIPFFYYVDIYEEMDVTIKGKIIMDNFDGSYTLLPMEIVILLGIWLILSIVYISYQFYKYFYLKQSIKRNAERESGKKELLLLKKNKKVSFYIMKNSSVKTPFTLGIFHSWIVLPDMEINKEIKEMILSHEMTHIENKDVLFKFICLGICLIHWFNPFSWLLLYEYGIVSEYRCDDNVVMNSWSLEQKKEYATMMVLLAERKTKIPIVFYDTFSKGGKSMKKRIERILNPIKIKCRAFPVIIFLSVLLSSSTVMAYASPRSVSVVNSEMNTIWIEDADKDNIIQTEKKLNKNIDFSVSDTVFEDAETAEIVNIVQKNQIGQYAFCIHTMKDGFVNEHTPNSTGGCVVIRYSARYCTKCGYYVIQEEVSRTTYKTCPH